MTTNPHVRLTHGHRAPSAEIVCTNLPAKLPNYKLFNYKFVSIPSNKAVREVIPNARSVEGAVLIAVI
jgi:hypothetical protein